MELSLINIILSSAVVATLISVTIQVGILFFEKDKESYEKLYGPLKYHLLMMRIITENNKEVCKEVREIQDVEMRVKSLRAHLSPLTTKWLSHREAVRVLIQENSGFIKKSDFDLMGKFLDACLKREIAQEGQNALSTEERMGKIIDIEKELQERFLA